MSASNYTATAEEVEWVAEMRENLSTGLMG